MFTTTKIALFLVATVCWAGTLAGAVAPAWA